MMNIKSKSLWFDLKRSGRLWFIGCCLAVQLPVFAAAPVVSTEPTTNRLINITDSWSYNVNKVDLGTAWRDPGYADGDWATGGGLLYVESGSLPAPKTTALPLIEDNLPTTCYFRTEFNVDLSEAYSIELVANTVVDDGLVLYLNGTEVLRHGMPEGTVTYDTFANTTVGNAAFQGPYALETSSLVDGVNVLAAEVHQLNSTSSDIVMGLTLDAISTEPIEDTVAPEISTTLPSGGSSLTNLTQMEITFSEAVQGVDAADLLINGVPASGLTTVSTSKYRFQFAEPANGVVNFSWASGHGIADLSPDEYDFPGTGFSVLLAAPLEGAVELEFVQVSQSSDFSPATRAMNATDGSAITYSLTQDLAGSYWMAALGRPFELMQLQLVNRFAPDDAELAGCTLSVLNMDDQVVFETVLNNPGSGGIIVIDLPEGTVGRAVRIGLPDTQTNGAGTYRVGLAEVRLYGSPNIPFSPEPFVPEGDQPPAFSVEQSTEHSIYPAENAVDRDVSTFSHTDSNTKNNYWMADLAQENPITLVELVSRQHDGSAPRMDGLVIQILDENRIPVASDDVTNPGSGGTYSFIPPANTVGRYVKVGLQNDEANGYGDYVVQLAEVRAWSGAVNLLDPTRSLPSAVTNLASFKRSYMLRLTDALFPASNVNDNNMFTEASTTTRTVDGYWEVDLGETFALYGVRAVSATAVGGNLEGTVCRLFDENHDSVYEKSLTGSAPVYDVDLDGPIFARYVRVGLEDKSRTDGNAGGFIGFSEVEVFGRPEHEVGILSFTASPTTVAAGQNVTLNWTVEDVKRAELFPALGSVGSQTDTNGVGSLIQNMTESTEFILVATNNAGVFTRAVGVEVNGDSLPVLISEVLADNKYSLEDGYGDVSDWIELRNTGNSTVDLTGWGLSDNPSKPMKFVFPATTIAAHSTLIVFASNRDVVLDPAGNLHADFALGKGGETVQLTAPNGTTVMDSVLYPELDTDLSYGRALDGSWMLMEPTPNAVNTGATYGGWLNTLDWSHARGFYETNFTLTVTSEDPEATILYSLDGTEPSIPYTAGLPIAGTSVVRIQSVWPGYKSARIQTKTFLFLDDVIADSSMNTSVTQDPAYGPRVKPGLLALPTLSLVVSTTEPDVEDAIEYDEQACSLEILWPDGQDPIQEDCGISRFGGAYSYFAKKGLSLSFRQKYGNGKLSAPLFDGFDRGVLAKTSFDKLHLRGGNHDFSRSFGMSDRFIQDSYLDMGSLNPHGRFVHVYLNGEYWGQYNLKEVLNESFLSDYLGGSSADYVSVKGNDNGNGAPDGWVIGAGDPPNPEPWERVRAFRDDFEAVSPYLDVSHFIDYMLLWGYGGCENEFRGCGPKEAGSGHKFWINDPDGFLNVDRSSTTRIIGTYGPGGIWEALQDEGHIDFKMLLADRIYKNFFNNGAMTAAQCTARLEARMDETRDSFVAECARWNRSYTTWEAGAEEAYTDFFPYQADDLVTAWRNAGYLPSFDPPTFNQYGGAVLEGFQPVLSSSDGTIYYTLDGTDPRLAGGGIAPSALVWSAGAVSITEDTTITTRVRTSGGDWSALAEPRFLLGSRQFPMPGELVISEINYNPAGSDEYEFIEIWNSGTNLLDLSGVNISNAVRYIFPEYSTLNPGAHVVVVEDAMAFSNRYENASSPWYWAGVDVAGEWVGGLSDGGERIAILSADGTIISSVRYRSDGDWPERPDGGGSSLELRTPAAVPEGPAAQSTYLDDGRNWIASSLYHGSPGRFDSGGAEVVINEVLAHTDLTVDWIEFYNAGTGPASLSNMAITDKLDLPARYLIPNGTSIAGQSYLTVSAADLGFGFSELGSDAYLLELSGTNIVRIVDGVSFPAVEREEPFGRYERSDGEIDFTELLSVTPGAANARPRVGPVVISEIMFAPDAGYSEYVEIMNISDAAVPLYDSVLSSNVWTFSGVGDFSFPEGTVLESHETALVCATNPAVFRAQYSVGDSVQIFGPWTGGLAADGEKLQLLYPGDPEQDGFVPMYRADHVTYRTNNVWPEVSSGGVSLERSPLTAYGNDPAHWRASAAQRSPGFSTEYLEPFVASLSSSSGGYPSIAFPALYAQSYEIEYTDSLTDPDWKPLTTVTFASTNPVVIIDSNDGVDHRYYRVVLLGFATEYSEPFASTISASSAGTPTVTFPALYGQSYDVYYTNTLTDPDWQLLESVPYAATQRVEVIDSAPTNSTRYYQIMMNP